MAETLRELAGRARDARAALAAHVSELPLALAHLAAVLPAVAPEGFGEGPQAAAGLAGALAPHLDAMDAQARPCHNQGLILTILLAVHVVLLAHKLDMPFVILFCELERCICRVMMMGAA